MPYIFRTVEWGPECISVCVDRGQSCLKARHEGMGIQLTTFLTLQSHGTTIDLAASDRIQTTYLHAIHATFALIGVVARNIEGKAMTLVYRSITAGHGDLKLTDLD